MYKQKFIDYYMAIAELTSTLSYAKKLKVGCVIVKNHKILATGYNGTPSGWDNNCENIEWCSAGGWLDSQEIEEQWPYEGTYLDSNGNKMQGRYKLVTKSSVIHAESNALLKVASSTENTIDSTMFCTHSPCIECSKLIYQSGINNLYYRNSYRSADGIDFLKECGVNVIQY